MVWDGSDCLKVAGIIGLSALILFLMRVVQCCIDSSPTTPTVKRRRRSHQSISKDASRPLTDTATAPPQTFATRTVHNGSGVDDVVSDPNQGRQERCDDQDTPVAVQQYMFESSPPLANAINATDRPIGFPVPKRRRASPVVVPPYPVEARHPTPQTVPLGPGFTTHIPPYPTQPPHPVPGAAPYPPAVGAAPYPPSSGATPYTPPVGAAPYPPVSTGAPYPPVSTGAPYPPTGLPVGGTAPYPDYGAQPPSYSEAVSQPPVDPLPAKEGYSKQAPYNPNY